MASSRIPHLWPLLPGEVVLQVVFRQATVDAPTSLLPLKQAPDKKYYSDLM